MKQIEAKRVWSKQSFRTLTCVSFLCTLLLKQFSEHIRLVATSYTSPLAATHHCHGISSCGVCKWAGSISKKTGVQFYAKELHVYFFEIEPACYHTAL